MDDKTKDNAPAAETQQKVTLTCPKHRDVSNTSLLLNLRDLEAPTEKITQYIYCLYCLNDILLAFQKEGALPPLEVKVEEVEKVEEPVDPVTAAVKKTLPFIKK